MANYKVTLLKLYRNHYLRKFFIFSAIYFSIYLIHPFDVIYNNFILETIEIRDNNLSLQRQIIKKINYLYKTPILSIDLAKLNDEIISISPWIKTTIIRRIWPSKLIIHIVEYMPCFIWSDDSENNNIKFFDKHGNIINDSGIVLNKLISYPVVKGKNAYKEVDQLITMINSNRELFKEVKIIEYIEERRWNLEFKNRLLVKLPEYNLEDAIDYLKDNLNLLESNNIDLIDLRLLKAEKIFVKYANGKK